MSTSVALQRTVIDIIDEYDQKVAGIDQAIKAFEDAKIAIGMAGTIMGTYASPVLQGHACTSPHRMQKNLLQSGWRAIYNRLQIDRIASADDKRLFERTIADPPPLTFDNAKATFGPYLENPRSHILRGLAETFASLDPAYRSHSKVKVGVKGLPKRIIISSFGSWGSYGRDRLRDVVNALAAYRGQPLMSGDELGAIGQAHRDGDDAHLDGRTYFGRERYGKRDEYQTLDRGMTIRKFGNGNAHVFFDADALRDINRGLAEFYGDVLPDVDPDHPEKAPSTVVAKDLQFYWSPEPVVDAALEFGKVWNLTDWHHNPPDPLRILEPSCGDGRILDALASRGHRALGIEYHAVRQAQALAKGHKVLLANFLACPPRAEFDRVVMNPPFYGRHYLKHIRHARKFLKPDGLLVSILPATAWYDHKDLDGEWQDLPVGSFSEAGTNVPTGMIKMRAAA